MTPSSPMGASPERALAPDPIETLGALGEGVRIRSLAPGEVANADAPEGLVLVVEPGEDASPAFLAAYLAQHKDALRAYLARQGCLLFRGFDLERERFEAAVAGAFEAGRYVWMFPLPPGLTRRLLNLPLFGALLRWLLGRIEARSTGRKIQSKDISTLAADDTIQFPHHEYGIFFNIPQLLAFYCEEEAGTQGETYLCDGEAAFQQLPPEVRARFEATAYIRYRNQNQWYFPPFSAPAILHHPMTGAPTVNLTAFHHDVVADVARGYFPEHRIFAEEVDDTFLFEPRFVDAQGGPVALTRGDVEAVVRAHLDNALLLPWRRGDLLLMDNFKILHGRLNAGTPKKTLQIVLCDYVRNRNGFVW